MRQNPFTFPVQFKLWVLCNDQPSIKGTNEGIWSRIRLIPFDHFFPEDKRIKDLVDILVAEEGPAILGWLVKGCQQWQQMKGLAEPQKVLAAGKTYRNEQDVLEAFLGEYYHSYTGDHPLATKAKVKATELYAKYVGWCKEAGEKNVLTKRRFGTAVTNKNHPLEHVNGVCWRLGLKLISTQEPTRSTGCDDE